MSNSIDNLAALSKARHFTNYQERSSQEVIYKLREWGLAEVEHPFILITLAAEGLLDEERFARSYARGKFRLKNWGKVKIEQGLLRKGVAHEIINLALGEIDEEEYTAKLDRLIAKKSSMPGDHDSVKKQSAIARFASSQGYEPSLVWDLIHKHERNESSVLDKN